MSTDGTSDPLHSNPLGSKSKKNKKKKVDKSKLNRDPGNSIDIKIGQDNRNDETEAEETNSKPLTDIEISSNEVEGPIKKSNVNNAISTANGTSLVSGNTISPEADAESSGEMRCVEIDEAQSSHEVEAATLVQIPRDSSSKPFDKNTEARLDALARERSALREEVAQLRRSLEEIQEKHEEDLLSVREQLKEVHGEKVHAETQYRNLLGKVNTIKSQLGDRLKADAEDLSQARTRIEDLEEQCGTLQEENDARASELARMAEEGEQRSKELSSIRNRTTLSQQNWSKEREDLVQRELVAKEDFMAAKQAMQEWEVLAREERSVRESMTERVTDLEEQLSGQREAHERAASERDTLSLTVEGLQRALQEIQDARRRELRELVEISQGQIESLQKKLQNAELEATEATKSLDSTKKQLERALPFEKEAKDKNLLIGKLRHEAVTLNDHLTKALRYLRKRKPEENIDKQLVTNHFLHFLALERSDPKKFQVLQIIAALLAWSDEQREQAGLSRPGASNPNLRVPVSPWHRTPSTPALSTEFFPEGGSRKESLAELWSDFLEQEAQEGVRSPKSPSAS
ncbi:hypothetical protein MMC07_009937, partial [Pseudocyphellaria aurata]|nr:hypothetical protein [Pseudocyphellaria aurata]